MIYQTQLDPGLLSFCQIIDSAYYGECRGTVKDGFKIGEAKGTIIAYNNETGVALVVGDS